MLGRLTSLNGSESRPGSSAKRPGSSDSSLRGQYTMPVPEPSDAYSWRQPAAATDPRRPPPGALPPQVPGYTSVHDDERPPSSPSDGYSMRGDQTARPVLRPYSPSQHSTSSYGTAPQLPHSYSCACRSNTNPAVSANTVCRSSNSAGSRQVNIHWFRWLIPERHERS